MNRSFFWLSSRNAFLLSLVAATAAFCVAQTTPPAPAAPTAPVVKVPPKPPTVFVNPRSGSDDPRVGLKGGLYDAATAISGMQLVMATPKPSGFAPDIDSIKAIDATPAPAPIDPDAPRPRPAPGAARPTVSSSELWRHQLRPRFQHEIPLQRQLFRN